MIVSGRLKPVNTCRRVEMKILLSYKKQAYPPANMKLLTPGGSLELLFCLGGYTYDKEDKYRAGTVIRGRGTAAEYRVIALLLAAARRGCTWLGTSPAGTGMRLSDRHGGNRQGIPILASAWPYGLYTAVLYRDDCR